VPDPFVITGATHGLAFNLADLFAVSGDTVLLSVVVLLGLQRRTALREPV
jgi:NAD(P)-dependent dehydrogenase (short-subunit alcohol dehydrogenase family)